MNREDMLASLIAQAGAEGSDLTTLRAIVEEATDLGAERVLSRLGLADQGAQDYIDELRELLQAWRDAKTAAWKAVVGWTVRGLLALLLIAIAWRIGLPVLFR
jgi:hypothetical protein